MAFCKGVCANSKWYHVHEKGFDPYPFHFKVHIGHANRMLLRDVM